MEGFFSREHALSARVERGQLQSVLVGLGTTINKEEAIVLVAAGAAQAFGQLTLQTVHHRIGVEAQTCDLLADGLHITGMGMAYADDGMAAIEVQIFCSLPVPHTATLAAHDVNREEGIDVKKFHSRALLLLKTLQSYGYYLDFAYLCGQNQ